MKSAVGVATAERIDLLLVPIMVLEAK